MKAIRLFLILAMLGIAGMSYGQNQPAVSDAPEATGMSESAAISTFFVQVPHTKEQCMQALDEMKNKGDAFLTSFEYGCVSGDHTAYGFLKGTSKDAVKQMLPKSEQADAKIVKVKKFTSAEIESMHKSM